MNLVYFFSAVLTIGSCFVVLLILLLGVIKLAEIIIKWRKTK